MVTILIYISNLILKKIFNLLALHAVLLFSFLILGSIVEKDLISCSDVLSHILERTVFHNQLC